MDPVSKQTHRRKKFEAKYGGSIGKMPVKPKGMHWVTFTRYVALAREAEHAGVMQIARLLGISTRAT